MTELFAEVVSAEPPPVKNEPYFLFGYWPIGGYWKLFPGLYDDPGNVVLRNTIEKSKKAGWCFLTVCRLPESE